MITTIATIAMCLVNASINSGETTANQRNQANQAAVNKHIQPTKETAIKVVDKSGAELKVWAWNLKSFTPTRVTINLTDSTMQVAGI